jgi:hypothetical protein
VTAVDSSVDISADPYQIIVSSVRKELSDISSQIQTMRDLPHRDGVEQILTDVINQPHPRISWLKQNVQRLVPWLSHLTTLATNLHTLKRLVGIE